MSQNRRKKVVYTGGKDPELLRHEKDTKKLSGVARTLLYASVVVIGGAQVLDTGLGLIPRGAGDVLTLVGLGMLLAALAIHGRSGSSGGRL